MSAGVVIDTSVWIDFFRGKLSPKYKDALILLLESDEVVITDVIKHELLVGARSKKDYAFLTDALSSLREIAIEPEARAAFSQFGFELKVKGLLGKYTDLSIAFVAKRNGLTILSFDKYFAKLASMHIVSVLPI